jgi:O-antigen/teichoic acid export membrane protein
VRLLVAGCYLVGAAAAAVVGAGFALGAGWWAPDLIAAVGRGGLVAFLTVAAPVWAVFVMQDYVLTALGRAVRVPIANLAFAVAKLGLLAVAAGFAIHAGIALSWLAATVLMVAVVSVVVFRLLPARSAGTRVTPGEVTRFVRADYAGELCWTAVVFGLPVVVLTRLGPEAAATFGIAWTIAYSLFLVPHGLGQAMVAHLAADPGGLAAARRGMVLRAYALLVPAVLVLVFAARPLLAVFGPHYAATGVTVLVLAALPEVVVRSAIAAARVQRRAAVLGGLPAAVAGMVLAGSWVLAPRLGLVGVGAALLIAETLAAAVVLAADRRATPRRARRAAWPATVTATARRASGRSPPAVRSRSG